jgi:hypothetical protein
LVELQTIYDEEIYAAYVDDPSHVLYQLQKCIDDCELIDLQEIRREFWESCESYDKILSHKHIYEVKFNKLLSSRFNYFADLEAINNLILDDIEAFQLKIKSLHVTYELHVENQIFDLYQDLSYKMHSLNGYIRGFLNEWNDMGTPFSKPLTQNNFSSDRVQTVLESVKEDTTLPLSNTDITLNRQFLALYYLLNEVDKEAFARNKSETARFFKLLTGKSYENIYKRTKNPFKDPTERTSKKYQSDIQFIKESFLKLGLNKIAQQIENDNLVG